MINNNISDIIVTAIERERLEQGKDSGKAKPLSVRAMAQLLGLRQQTLDKILKRQQGIGGKSFATIMHHRPEWWTLLNSQEKKPPC